MASDCPGTLKVPACCPCCESELTLNKTMLRCCTCASHCDRKEFQQSIFENSFFEGAHDKKQLLLFLCCWLCGATTERLGMHIGWSKSKLRSGQQRLKRCQQRWLCLIIKWLEGLELLSGSMNQSLAKGSTMGVTELKVVGHSEGLN